MNIEVKQEGTLMFLYVNGVAKECVTMHTHDERSGLMRYAAKCVVTLFEAENLARKAARMSPVTLESFATKVAGPNVRIWVLADGSKPYPFAWIPGLEGVPKQQVAIL